MFCPNCGKEVEEGSKFCTNCGFNVKENSTNIKYNNTVDNSVKNENVVNKKVKKSKLLIVFVLLIFIIGGSLTGLYFVTNESPILLVQNLISNIGNDDKYIYNKLDDNLYQNVSKQNNDNLQNDNKFEETIAIDSASYELSRQIANAKVITDYDIDATIDMVDTVTFGLYAQSNEFGNTKDPIEWIVLDKQNDKALLLSKYILDCVKYYDSYNENNNWSNSNFRHWLNNDFLINSFNDNEQECILNKNDDDKIFILNNYDIDKYFNIYNQNVYNCMGDESDTKKLNDILVNGHVGDLWIFNKPINKLKTHGTNYTDYMSNVFSYDAVERGSIEYSDLYRVESDFIFLDGVYPNYVSYNSIGAHEGGFDTMNLPVRPAIWVKLPQQYKFFENISGKSVNVYQNSDGSMQIGGTPKEGARLIQSKKDESQNSDLSIQIANAKVITDYDKDVSIDMIDTVSFGSYPQSDVSGNTKEPIEWIVLEKQNDRALLLSKYLIDAMAVYTKEDDVVTWEISILRNWLNDVFYNDAFDDNKNRTILSSQIKNENNIENDLDSPSGKYDVNIYAGNDTYDKVFVLSKNEIIKYFGVKDRYAGPTVGYHMYNNVLSRGTKYVGEVDISAGPGKHLKGYENFWWTRTPGLNGNGWSTICFDYDFNSYFSLSNVPHETEMYGVRPAIWVSINGVNLANVEN